MQKILDFFDKVKTNWLLKFFIYCVIIIGSILILVVIFLFWYILIKSPSISEWLWNAEKFVWLIWMPSWIYYLREIDKKLSKILSEESKK